MKKLKIKGVTNTKDSMWFRFNPNVKTLEKLNDIFNLSPQNTFREKGINYKNAFGKEGRYYLIETKNCTVYLILSEKYVHLILRKIKKFGNVKNTIFEHFELGKNK